MTDIRKIPKKISEKVGYKFCRKCDLELELCHFRLHKGSPYYACNKCEYERMRIRNAKRNADHWGYAKELAKSIRARDRKWARDRAKKDKKKAKRKIHLEAVKKRKEDQREKKRLAKEARKAISKINSRLSRQAWKKANVAKLNAYAAHRHARLLQRTPKWLTKEQLLEIQQFYIWAKECRWLSEEPLEVDHIVPLMGENVCGLHVPWNLQILPESVNISKSNKF